MEVPPDRLLDTPGSLPDVGGFIHAPPQSGRRLEEIPTTKTVDSHVPVDGPGSSQ